MISIWRPLLCGVFVVSMFVVESCTSCDEEGKELAGAGTTPGTETQPGSGGTDPLGRPIGEDGLVEIEPGKKVLAGQPPGTGGITGSVSAEGVRGADAGGAQAAVRGGIRGGVRGVAGRPVSSPTQAVQSAQAPKRHPMGPNKRDKCAWFAKYSDLYCDVDCVQYDPDCQVLDSQVIALTEGYVINYYGAYGMGKDEGEVKNFEEFAGKLMKSFPKDLNKFVWCEHVEDHQGNGYCEEWQPRKEVGKHPGGAPIWGPPTTAQEWQKKWDFMTSPTSEVGVNDYLAAKNGLPPGSTATLKELGLKPPPEPEVVKCYQLDPDCSTVSPDTCALLGYYGDISAECHKECAMPDPDCVTGGEPQLIVGAEVCLEGTSFCTYTDENGEYKLVGVPPGEYVMVIKKQGKSGQTYAASQKVIVAADNVVMAGNKAIEETGSISGKVQRADAKNHLGTDVFVPGTSFTAKTDEQGNFILLGMPAGTYSLAAMFPGFETDKWENVEVKAKTDTKVAAATLAHAPEDVKPRTVSGQVLDTDGAAVGNAIVSTTPESDKATTDLNGNFVLKGLQPTSYGIKAGKGGYTSSTRKVDLTSIENTDITIILTNFIGKTDNEAPQIKIAGPQTAQPTESVKLTAEVTDPDGTDLLFVKWSANGGSLSSTTGAEVNWTAPVEQGVFVVSATVTDGTAAAFGSHPITSAKGGALLSIDTSRPYQPKANLLSVASNAPGTEDSISGSAGAVEAGTTLKIYADGLLQTKVGEGTVASDGSFGPINVGDNKGDANDLLYLVVFDAFGNMSDRFFFLNDKTPPDVTLTKQPCGVGTVTCYIGSNTATFEFIVSEAGATVACKLDSGAYASCSSPATFSNLQDGTHLLLVLATDAAQNQDPSPAAYAWAVDATAPSAGTVTPANTATSTHVDSPFDLSTTFIDAASGVQNCQYCLATDGACDSEWTAATFSAGTCSVASLTCTEGQTVTLNMRATDGAGKVGTGTAVSRVCDTAAPLAATVKDGLGADYDIQTKSTNVVANWTASSDATSGVDHYEFAVGTSTCTGAAPANIAAYTANGTTLTASVGSLALAAGSTYYVNVKTHDKVGNSRCDSSDGVQILSAVADAGSVGAAQVSLALDASGRPHLCAQKGSALRYAKNLTGTWDVATVDSGGDIPGSHCSIAVDSSGYAHVSYYQSYTAAQNLRYATNKTGSWVLTPVDETVANTGLYTSIALDNSGNPHISYQDATNNDLKYAKFVSSGGSGCTSGAWTCETADAAGGTYTSLVVDASGKAHISYYAALTMTYATNTTGSWVTTGIASTGIAGATSIARDSAGKFHISFFANASLRYATNASGSWAAETVDSSATVGTYNGIGLDSNNKVHVGYWDSDNGDLKYATGTAANFTKSTVESAGNVGQYCSLRLDSGGNPFIAHFDGTNSDARFLAVNP